MTTAAHLRTLGVCLVAMVSAPGASALDAVSPPAPGSQSPEPAAAGSAAMNSKPGLSVPPMAPSTGAANAAGRSRLLRVLDGGAAGQPQPAGSGRRSRGTRCRTRPEFRHPDTADGCIRDRRLSARSADPAARGCGGKARRAVRPGDRARDPEAMPRAPADRDRDIRDRGPVAGAPRAGRTGRRKSIPGGGGHRSICHAAIEHGPRKAAGALHDCAQARESRAGSAALWLVLNSSGWRAICAPASPMGGGSGSCARAIRSPAMSGSAGSPRARPACKSRVPTIARCPTKRGPETAHDPATGKHPSRHHRQDHGQGLRALFCPARQAQRRPPDGYPGRQPIAPRPRDGRPVPAHLRGVRRRALPDRAWL